MLESQAKYMQSRRSVRHHPWTFGCVAVVATLFFGGSGYAQVVLDGSVGRREALAGPRYVIESDFGKTKGSNLFHSFDQFKVGPHDVVEFKGPPSITNIVARVTGGASSIEGTIDSVKSMPSANFFLLNPKGIVLGPNAKLQVGGAFHASTADYIRFADGRKYFADLSKRSRLSVADPVAFGFLGGARGMISVAGSIVVAATGKGLSFTGGDIKIVGATLNVPSGGIHVRSIVSGEVPLSPTAEKVGIGGAVEIVGSTLLSSDQPGGEVLIQGGQLVLVGSTIESSTTGTGRGADIRLKADQLTLDNVNLTSKTSGFGPGGDIRIDTGRVSIRSGFITTQNDGFGGQSGGNASICATDSIEIAGTSISSQVGFGGTGGTVKIAGKSLAMSEGAAIVSANMASESRGGDVSVEVQELRLSGGASVQSFTYSPTNGAGGNINLSASNSAWIGDTGTQVVSASFSEAPAGDICVHVGSLTLTHGALILAGAFEANRGGNLTVTAAGSVVISDQAGISSQAFLPNVSPVTLSAGTLHIDGGFISTSTLEVGNAGDIALDIHGSLTLTNGGQIASSSISADGAGGNINVNADESVTISGISPTGKAPAPDLFKSDDASSGIFSTTSSPTHGAGPAGSIHVHTRDLALVGGGKLSVATTGAGPAGAIVLDVDGKLTMSNAGAIISASGTGEGEGTGTGGDINIAARSINMAGGSIISASSTGSAAAAAGNVSIVFGDALRMDRSSIATKSQVADGGNITITSTGSMLTLTNSQITTSVASGSGSGGTITIGSHLHPLTFAILSGSQILTTAVGGNGGDIDIFADTYLLSGSLVDASSLRREPGTINVEARITDLSGSLAELPDNFLQAANLLRAACAARVKDGMASSLVVAPREGLPPEPDGMLASPLGISLADLDAAQNDGYVTQPSLQLAGLWAGSSCTR